ncbi:MAG: diaminopimelate epimerase [Myxococcaceae bacterium]|jgi:diaminopimelate epimerase|nr:diaminopimelate epimerase [Myxococcaceae bacterium]
MQPFVERFFKYHGLGNDFVVLDRRASGVDVDADTSRRLCDRHFGVGADGVLTVLPHAGAAGRMVVHNADGSIAEMCGNGLRCVVKYVAERAGDHPARLDIATGAGVLTSELEWQAGQVERVTVAMGPARLSARSLPNGGPFVQQPIDGVIGTAVSMGNPHLVLLATPPAEAARLGPGLERHPLFVDRANVEFVEPRPEGGLRVTVWERGVGLTLACGTGACAAVVASALAGQSPFDAWVPVELPGGRLELRVAADLSQVWLRGPVRFVYEGVLP